MFALAIQQTQIQFKPNWPYTHKVACYSSSKYSDDPAVLPTLGARIHPIIHWYITMDSNGHDATKHREHHRASKNSRTTTGEAIIQINVSRSSGFSLVSEKFNLQKSRDKTLRLCTYIWRINDIICCKYKQLFKDFKWWWWNRTSLSSHSPYRCHANDSFAKGVTVRK